MGVTKNNLYTGVYDDLNTYSVAATSMKSAVALLTAQHGGEPASLKVVAKDVITGVDSGDKVKITATVSPVTEGAAVYPEQVEAEIGDTVYFTAVVPDGSEIVKWTFNDKDVTTTEKQLKLTVDSTTAEVAVVCVMKQTEELPDTISDFLYTAKPTNILFKWTNPTDCINTFIVVVDELTETTKFSGFVGADVTEKLVDGLDVNTSYIFSARVLGSNGLYSEAFTQTVKTAETLSAHPAVADLDYVAADKKFTWVLPTDAVFTEHATGLTFVLADDTGEVVVSETLPVSDTEFVLATDITVDTGYTATVKVLYDDELASEEVSWTMA